MANFFRNNQSGGVFTPRQQLERKYESARGNLLAVVAFTVINIIIAASGGDSYFLFSAFIPYLIITTGMILCGKYTGEYSIEEMLGVEPLGESAFVVFVVIAFIITMLYLLAWACSGKQRVGWIIFALVIFGIDTLALISIGGIGFESLIDLAFHAWVIYYLISGIIAWNKLKNLEDEPMFEAAPEGDSQPQTEAPVYTSNSIAKRVADTEVKAKILLEADALGHKVTYRRVKKVNELVIDGYVYDELEATVEFPHTLTATIDGHTIVAGLDSVSQSYILLDGERIAKKLRLI